MTNTTQTLANNLIPNGKISKVEMGGYVYSVDKDESGKPKLKFNVKKLEDTMIDMAVRGGANREYIHKEMVHSGVSSDDANRIIDNVYSTYSNVPTNEGVLPGSDRTIREKYNAVMLSDKAIAQYNADIIGLENELYNLESKPDNYFYSFDTSNTEGYRPNIEEIDVSAKKEKVLEKKRKELKDMRIKLAIKHFETLPEWIRKRNNMEDANSFFFEFGENKRDREYIASMESVADMINAVDKNAQAEYDSHTNDIYVMMPNADGSRTKQRLDDYEKWYHAIDTFLPDVIGGIAGYKLGSKITKGMRFGGVIGAGVGEGAVAAAKYAYQSRLAKNFNSARMAKHTYDAAAFGAMLGSATEILPPVLKHWFKHSNNQVFLQKAINIANDIDRQQIGKQQIKDHPIEEQITNVDELLKSKAFNEWKKTQNPHHIITQHISLPILGKTRIDNPKILGKEIPINKIINVKFKDLTDIEKAHRFLFNRPGSEYIIKHLISKDLIPEESITMEITNRYLLMKNYLLANDTDIANNAISLLKNPKDFNSAKRIATAEGESANLDEFIRETNNKDGLLTKKQLKRHFVQLIRFGHNTREEIFKLVEDNYMDIKKLYFNSVDVIDKKILDGGGLLPLQKVDGEVLQKNVELAKQDNEEIIKMMDFLSKNPDKEQFPNQLKVLEETLLDNEKLIQRGSLGYNPNLLEKSIPIIDKIKLIGEYEGLQKQVKLFMDVVKRRGGSYGYREVSDFIYNVKRRAKGYLEADGNIKKQISKELEELQTMMNTHAEDMGVNDVDILSYQRANTLRAHAGSISYSPAFQKLFGEEATQKEFVDGLHKFMLMDRTLFNNTETMHRLKEILLERDKRTGKIWTKKNTKPKVSDSPSVAFLENSIIANSFRNNSLSYSRGNDDILGVVDFPKLYDEIKDLPLDSSTAIENVRLVGKLASIYKNDAGLYSALRGNALRHAESGSSIAESLEGKMQVVLTNILFKNLIINAGGTDLAAKHASKSDLIAFGNIEKIWSNLMSDPNNISPSERRYIETWWRKTHDPRANVPVSSSLKKTEKNVNQAKQKAGEFPYD